MCILIHNLVRANSHCAAEEHTVTTWAVRVVIPLDRRMIEPLAEEPVAVLSISPKDEHCARMHCWLALLAGRVGQVAETSASLYIANPTFTAWAALVHGAAPDKRGSALVIFQERD